MKRPITITSGVKFAFEVHPSEIAFDYYTTKRLLDLSKTFMDIDELSSKCKFTDCTHTNEPKYENLNSKQIEKDKITEMFSEVGGMKKARKYIKSKNKMR